MIDVFIQNLIGRENWALSLYIKSKFVDLFSLRDGYFWREKKWNYLKHSCIK